MPTDVAVRVAPMKMPAVARSALAIAGCGRQNPVDEAQGEGQRHADRGHGQRGGADAEHLLEVGLEADLEEQEEDAQLGEDVHQLGRRTVGGDHAEDAAAEQDSRDQLAEDRRLADALRRVAEHLGGDEHGGEDEEEAGGVRPALGRQEGNGGRQEQPCPTAAPPREGGTRTCDGRRAARHALRYSVWMVILDGDPPRYDVELGRLTQDRVRRPLEAALDHVVPDGRRDAGLEPHRVLDAVVAEGTPLRCESRSTARPRRAPARSGSPSRRFRGDSADRSPLGLGTLHDVGHQLVQCLAPSLRLLARS